MKLKFVNKYLFLLYLLYHLQLPTCAQNLGSLGRNSVNPSPKGFLTVLVFCSAMAVYFSAISIALLRHDSFKSYIFLRTANSYLKSL